MRTDKIGDLMLSTPVIKNIRLACPDSHIAFMCLPYTKDIVEGNPYLDEVITYDKSGKHKNPLKSFFFSFYLRKKKFDLAVVLHPTNRVHIMMFLAGIPVRVGWDRKIGWLLTKRIPHLKQQGRKHELEYTLDILRVLDISIVDKNMYFPIKEAAEQRIEELLKKNGVFDNRFVVINPGASCPSRRWPISHFCELANLFSKYTGYKMIVISSLEECKISDRLVKQGNVIDARGILGLAEIGSLIKRASLVISNDSGPVHIAAALGIAVISIFGRKNPGISPQRWRPLGAKSFYLHKDVGCRLCLAHNCKKGFLCLRAIMPEEVFEKASEILGITKKSTEAV